MIADYTRFKDKSGINISCSKPCVAMVDIDWKNQLNNISDSIVFIDEGAEYIRTPKFAREVKKSDNYYVIFSRESLHDLPYSVEEIYEIKASGKYHTFTKMFKSDTSVLDNPSEYIESKDYFSWENFFEDYLTQESKDTPFQYSKREINPAYLNESNRKKIIAEIGEGTL